MEHKGKVGGAVIIEQEINYYGQFYFRTAVTFNLIEERSNPFHTM